MKTAHLVALLLCTFFVLVFFSSSDKSGLCDEAGHHIGAGYSYLKTGNFKMNPAQPPLVRMLMASPLLYA